MTTRRPPAPSGCSASALPQARAGVSLKPAHFREIVETWPDLGFFELHAENYMVDGGPFHRCLARIRERYPLSIHGVGLSIGGDAPLDASHLDLLAALLDRYAPQSFSEHLAWSRHDAARHDAVFLNDLLPIAYNARTLQRVCEHIDQVQTRLKRRMLLENPATYVEYAASSIPEADFICEILRRTGCGLLLDVSNVYVPCVNHHRDPWTYVRALAQCAVGEIHLAGFTPDQDAGGDSLLGPV